ncbi:DNA methyltransferase [Xylella fastidiosa]|uniref:DNA methyltransferase n=1 Tax=Xylella fastidiosa TaxID=2371 RepID=UPI0022860435|nr:DNA methyltransferase [Xylella fastidiosa]
MLRHLLRTGCTKATHCGCFALALMEHLIKIVPPASTILDPFAGSGTTGVAALRAGHRFIGMEMSRFKYV